MESSLQTKKITMMGSEESSILWYDKNSSQI
jgi:hypothetical protein